MYKVAADPGGGDIAIGINNPAHPIGPSNPVPAGFTSVNPYVIAPDGHVVKQVNDAYWG